MKILIFICMLTTSFFTAQQVLAEEITICFSKKGNYFPQVDGNHPKLSIDNKGVLKIRIIPGPEMVSHIGPIFNGPNQEPERLGAQNDKVVAGWHNMLLQAITKNMEIKVMYDYVGNETNIMREVMLTGNKCKKY